MFYNIFFMNKSVYDNVTDESIKMLHEANIALLPYYSNKGFYGKDNENANHLINKQLAFPLVLEGGLEPPQPQWPRDFKSLVSTDSTIRACNRERKTGLEPATLTLARLCSTN